LKSRRGCAYVICEHHSISRKGLQDLQIWV
jgi:hypothetical protein